MRPTVVFIDDVCPKPYNSRTQDTEGLGGTERTVAMIASSLGLTSMFDVIVEQHNREETEVVGGVVWGRPGTGLAANYTISLRNPDSLARVKKRFPKAKHYLWLHDLPSRELVRALPILTTASALVCVSNWHRVQTIEALKSGGFSGGVPIITAYNPVEDSLVPNETPINKDRLAFISSPHKGLSNALSVFSALRRFNPNFTLSVANPGYYFQEIGKQEGVFDVGPLSYPMAMQLLRSSLCLFTPNFVYPETFGRVFAEANAVGTPVLTHGIGAAYEVLDRPDQEIVDCHNPKEVVERVMSWYNGGRPTVRVKKEFKLSNVLNTWVKRLLT